MSDNNNLHLRQIQQAGLSNFITLLIWWYLTMESLTTHNILFYVRRWRTKKEKSTVWFHLNIYFFRSTSKYVVLMPQRKKYALMRNGLDRFKDWKKRKRKRGNPTCMWLHRPRMPTAPPFSWFWPDSASWRGIHREPFISSKVKDNFFDIINWCGIFRSKKNMMWDNYG